MNIIESIKKSRHKNISDDLILKEIKRQNPQNNFLFEEMEKLMTSAEILSAIIDKLSPKEDIASKENSSLLSNVNKTTTDKETTTKDEEARKKFLQRIEAKEKEEENK